MADYMKRERRPVADVIMREASTESSDRAGHVISKSRYNGGVY